MSATPSDPADTGLTGKRFLVVEDEFLISLDIERILETAGVREIVVVSRNRDALSRLQSESFDVAILDLKLNGDSSVPVAERLTALRVPFVFITGGSAQTVPPGFRAVPVVIKPFDGGALTGALQKALGRG